MGQAPRDSPTAAPLRPAGPDRARRRGGPYADREPLHYVTHSRFHRESPEPARRRRSQGFLPHRLLAGGFPQPTSRSTTARPPAHALEQAALRLVAEDLHVVVQADRAGEEGEPALRVAVDEEPAALEDLHPEDGGGLVEVHQVDRPAQDLCELALRVEALKPRRAPP